LSIIYYLCYLLPGKGTSKDVHQLGDAMAKVNSEINISYRVVLHNGENDENEIMFRRRLTLTLLIKMNTTGKKNVEFFYKNDRRNL